MAAIHFIVDIKRVGGKALPQVVIRGTPPPPPRTHPNLTAGNDDTIQWANQLNEDVTVLVPIADRAFQKMPHSFPIMAGDLSDEYTVKKHVHANYKKRFSYIALVDQTGEYGEGGSDPEIEIK